MLGLPDDAARVHEQSLWIAVAEAEQARASGSKVDPHDLAVGSRRILRQCFRLIDAVEAVITDGHQQFLG